MATLLGRLFKPKAPTSAQIDTRTITVAPLVLPPGATVVVTARVDGMTREAREQFMSMLRGAFAKAKEHAPGSCFIIIPVVGGDRLKFEALVTPEVVED